MTMVAKRATRLIADMAEGEREFLTRAALRDKLISGELRVKRIERVIESRVL